jgi:methionyl-tRNA formyltransferase
LEQLQKIENLLFISLEFDKIINPNKFRTKNLFNMHFSALPSYKGMYTSALPILFGEARSGVTLHKIDLGIDTGDVVDQVLFDIPENCTARDLYFLYNEYALDLFKKTIFELIEKGANVSSAPQDSIGSTYFSKDFIDYSNLKINLQDTAYGITRQLRAFCFREYQIPEVYGLPIGSWEILPWRSKVRAGNIHARHEDSVVISSIDYDLHLMREKSWDWFCLSDNPSPSELNVLDVRFIDVRDKQGWTPLIRAAYSGNLDLCRVLLQYGANPNVGNLNGTTPLMYAFSGIGGNIKNQIINELLRFGADADQRNFFGKSLKDYGFCV